LAAWPLGREKAREEKWTAPLVAFQGSLDRIEASKVSRQGPAVWER
jgi:hypothetical protein